MFSEPESAVSQRMLLAFAEDGKHGKPDGQGKVVVRKLAGTGQWFRVVSTEREDSIWRRSVGPR